MKSLCKLLCVAAFFLLFFFPRNVFASDVFTTDYDVLYTVNPDLTTHTTLHVTLTNIVSDKYADAYKIEVGFDHIAHVSAYDPDGGMSPTIVKTDNGNSIEVKFNKHVVGKGNKLPFTIEFDTPDIAGEHGQIKEINVPGITNPEDFTSFNVEVKVPQSFGDPTYIKPQEFGKGLVFNKDMLGKSGISIAFGDKQLYAFTLQYHLKNQNLFPVRTEVALPPTTNYQDISITDITPKPSNVIIDKDGNWLAEYYLLPSAKVAVQVTGKASVYLQPKAEILSQDDLAKYLTPQQYWESSNVQIKELAQQLKTPEAIYDYVVKKLTYDYTRVSGAQERLGALAVLNHPSSAVCLEFSDLFIALARAAGIPAREVNGYAFTENAKQRPLSLLQDILHAWPEYYDTEHQAWVMIDPTWSNTTGGVDYFNVMDFDHLTFVIKGVKSDYPIPAGGYKYAENENQKDVDVVFTDAFAAGQQEVQVAPNVPSKVLSAFPINAHVNVKNVGHTLLHGQQLVITSLGLSPSKQVQDIDDIPPFGYEDISFAFYKKPFLTRDTFPVTMSVAGSVITRKITISPFFTEDLIIIGGVLIGVLTISILIIARKSRRI